MRRIAAAALLCVLCPSSASSATPKPPVTWIPAYWGNYQHITWTRKITYIVIHKMNGSTAGTIDWFRNPYSDVSTQYLVSHSGAIHQMVVDNDIAQHSGSYYNARSIGIENEGLIYRNDWTDAQYRSLAKLVAYLTGRYGIPRTRSYIIAHSDFSGLRDHQDPGPYFNWTYFFSLVHAYANGTSSGTTTTTTSSGVLKITDGPLNVRSGPGTGYSILGTVPTGQYYVTTATSGSWKKIWFDQRTGWIHGSYATRVTGISAVVVNTDALNVRTGSGTGYAIAGQAPRGAQYVWTRYEGLGGWYEIYWRGGKYYLHGSYVTRKGY